MELGEGLKKILLVGIGTAAVTAEKSKEILDELVRKGELTVEQGKVLNQELKHNIKSTVKNCRRILLKKTRTREYPVPGDYLEYTCRHGVWYPDVHIDSVMETKQRFAYLAAVRFGLNSLDFPKGGGPWDTLPADQFAYIGKRIRFFDLILPGLLGTRSLRFEVEVNVWGI